MSLIREKTTTTLPTLEDRQQAEKASQTLAKAGGRGEVRLRLNGEDEFTLPESARPFLAALLTEMANGNAVTLIPINAQLTTQKAADYLNVSRPYLIRQIENGKLMCHKVGTHRRINFTDLEAFKKGFETDREQALNEMTTVGQELERDY